MTAEECRITRQDEYLVSARLRLLLEESAELTRLAVSLFAAPRSETVLRLVTQAPCEEPPLHLNETDALAQGRGD